VRTAQEVEVALERQAPPELGEDERAEARFVLEALECVLERRIHAMEREHVAGEHVAVESATHEARDERGALGAAVGLGGALAQLLGQLHGDPAARPQTRLRTIPPPGGGGYSTRTS